jgi:hypothetical protein
MPVPDTGLRQGMAKVAYFQREEQALLSGHRFVNASLHFCDFQSRVERRHSKILARAR